MLTLLSKGYSSFLLSSFHTSAAPDGRSEVSSSICSKAERIAWECTKSAENEEYLKKKEKNGERIIKQYDESVCLIVCPLQSNSEKLH